MNPTLTSQTHDVVAGAIGGAGNEYGPKEGVIRFRCDANFTARVKRIAEIEYRTVSNLARKLLEDHVAEEEKRLGLPPIFE